MENVWQRCEKTPKDIVFIFFMVKMWATSPKFKKKNWSSVCIFTLQPQANNRHKHIYTYTQILTHTRGKPLQKNRKWIPQKCVLWQYVPLCTFMAVFSSFFICFCFFVFFTFSLLPRNLKFVEQLLFHFKNVSFVIFQSLVESIEALLQTALIMKLCGSFAKILVL